MSRPSPDRLFAALDATWPAAAFLIEGPWNLREGQGGGQRVSAATALGAVSQSDIKAAEDVMVSLGQRPLFMIRPEDEALDEWLSARRYDVIDPVTVYLGEPHLIAELLPPASAIPTWPPLAIQAEIWSEGGIGPERIAVMERATSPKCAVLGRSGNDPVATAFVAMDGDIAMLHALEVTPPARRRGVGRIVMQAAANWTIAEGGKWMTLAVTRENVGANKLYRSLGMTPISSYHYRRKPMLS